MQQLVSAISTNGQTHDPAPAAAPPPLMRVRPGTRPLQLPADYAPGALQDFLASVLHTLPAHIAILDEEGTILGINRTWRRFAQANGYDGTDYGLGANYLAVCDQAGGPGAEEAALVAHGLRQVLAGAIETFSIEYPCHSPSERRWFMLRATRIQGPGPGRVVVGHHDITERMLAEQNLQRERDFIAAVIDTAASLVVVLDRRGRIVRVNRACEQLTGCGLAEMQGRYLWDGLLLAEDAAPIVSALESLRAGQGACEFESQCMGKDGTRRVVAWSSTALRDGTGAVDYFIATGIDITARRQAEEALRELAIRDPLTELYNRRELNRLLNEELARYSRSGGPLVLALLDIDHFKTVNDRYGHRVGDDVLRWVTTVLTQSLRPTDRLARYGGEEFAVLLPATTSGEAFKIAERLRQAVAAAPFTLVPPSGAALRIPLTVSVGVAGVPHHAATVDSLIQAADDALYEAKHRGRNCTVHSAVRRAPIDHELPASAPPHSAVLTARGDFR